MSTGYGVGAVAVVTELIISELSDRCKVRNKVWRGSEMITEETSRSPEKRVFYGL